LEAEENQDYYHSAQRDVDTKIGSPTQRINQSTSNDKRTDHDKGLSLAYDTCPQRSLLYWKGMTENNESTTSNTCRGHTSNRTPDNEHLGALSKGTDQKTYFEDAYGADEETLDQEYGIEFAIPIRDLF
jgi:hypothetical protein